MSKRIVCMGAGAVGGYIGGHIARMGEDVTLIDPWPEHIEYIKHHGIHLSGTQGKHTVRVKALHLPTHAALTEVVKRVERGEIEAHPRNVEKL